MTERAPLRAITMEEIEAFERDGFVVLPGVLSPAWLAPLEHACARLLATPETLDITEETIRQAVPPPTQLFGVGSYAATLAHRGHFYMNFNTARRDPDVLAFALRGAIGSIAAALMRSATARFVDDILFVKDPDTAEPTEWHDDDGYSITTGPQRCSLWVSLGDVSEEAGPLRFLRGSHRRFPGWRTHGLKANSIVEAHPGEVEVCPVRVGDVVAHHLATIHGALPNRSGIPRRAWALRLAGDESRFVLPEARRESRTWYGLEDGEPLTESRFPLAWPPDEHEGV